MHGVNKTFQITIILFLFFSVFLKSPCFADEKEKVYETENQIILKIGDFSEKLSYSEYKSWFRIMPYLRFDPDGHSEIENIEYCPEGYFFCDFILRTSQRLSVVRASRFEIRDELIKIYLEDLARKINRDPVNAKFNLEDGKVTVFSLSEKGLMLDVEKSVEIITSQLEKEKGTLPFQTELALAYELIEPEITEKNLNNLGINSLIGEGKSNFRGSPRNRIHNIHVAASRFDGILIKPGEEFSFVKILGEVDAEHGYLPELVIKHNKTEPEFGGGICQVSTTAFRAAVYSGMKITARRNHAYPVQYYNPQGMDATVYIPNPDLRFINNTPGHVLIQTEIKGTELIFRFFGAADGREVQIEGPKIIERGADGSMKTVFTQTVRNEQGVEIIKDIFTSAYDSPSKYPHPGQEEILKEKPKNWSSREWKEYKKAHGI